VGNFFFKVFGAFLLFLIASNTSLARAPVCQSLFQESPSVFQQNKNLQKIDKHSSIPYARHSSFFISEAPLSFEAERLGAEFLKTHNFILAYQKDLNSTGKTLSEKKIFEFGKILYASAKNFAIAAGINFEIRKLSILDSASDSRSEVLVISTKGTHPLNIEARKLKEETGVEIIYSPYELLTLVADATFVGPTNRIYISGHILVSGSILKDDIGRHELTHMYIQQKFLKKQNYLFYGYVNAESGSLPGRSGAYNQTLYFEEIDAFFTSVDSAIDNIFSFKENSKTLDSKKSFELNYMNKEKFGQSLEIAHLVSVRSYDIFTMSLKSLSKNLDSIVFEDFGHHHMAIWRIESINGEFSYEVMIPIFPPKGASRADMISMLMKNLKAKQTASAYFRNLYKVGIDLNKKIQKLSNEESLSSLESYQKILSRKYDFDSHTAVPTQKQLAESLETRF